MIHLLMFLSSVNWQTSTEIASHTPTFRPNGRQNKISGQHTPPLASTSQAQGVGANCAVPFAPGVRVDLLRDLLKTLLTDEDCAKKSAQLEPKREEPTIYQDLADKFMEHGKVLSQVEHHRSVVRDSQLKLQKQQGILQELLERSQSLQLEIDSLQAQVEAAQAASATVLPSVLPLSVLPEGTPLVNADGSSGVQIFLIYEGDEEMEEVDEEEDNGSTVGSGVGAFLAPERKKTVKKTFLKKPSAKNASVKPETRSSVFAKAGTRSALELTRLY